MEDEARLFKILGDPTRLRLAVILALEGETCVCNLARALDAPDFKISRHLGIMRSAGMVEARRRETWMYYKLSRAGTSLKKSIYECLLNLSDNETIKEDLRRRNEACCSVKSVDPGVSLNRR